MSNSKLQRCIEECGNCQETCLATVAHCLSLGNHTDPQHIRTLLDCAEICQTAANFMLRGSELHNHVCGACAEICEACAHTCQAIAGGDEQMNRCVEACRRCAAACREMARLSPKAA
jgi:hypothetical protein